MAEEKIIGIDLGTTYSCAAVWQNDGVEVIPNEQGLRTTPSMVAFTGRERLVGDAAKHQVANNAANTLFDVKRLIGRRFSEATVQEDMKLWPFNVVRGDDDQALLQVQHRGRSRSFVPEEISSMLLTKMKNTAEAYLGAPVSRAVITVPAYFNDSQRRATKDAATIAGLEAVRIMNEPSAAALAYGISNSGDAGAAAPKTILVFDLGGGTFDVSVLTFRRDEFVVKGVAGDMHLGGEDFDHRLVSHCVAKFVRKNPQVQPDIGGNSKALRRLRAECEKAKRNLSVAVETVIDIEALHQGLDFRMKLSRAKFEELNADLFQRCIGVVAECIAEVGLRKPQIDEIVLVGGSSRIPKVMEMLSEFFGGKQLCRSMNPDEAVAIGAAYQAAALGKGAKQSFVLQDVTPLSLGVEVNNGAMQVLVKRNTAVPCAGKKVVSTLYDNQTEAAFRVFEGERPMVADNHFLGELVLTGIPRERAGIPRMKVLFQVDADGILKVSAQETKTGVSTQTTIKNDGGRLNAAQIQRMVADAERFKKFDEEAKQSHQAKNELQCFIHNMNTRLAERKRMRAIEPGLATHIERGLSAADDWVEEEDMYGHSHSHRFASKLAELKSLCKPLLRERS